MSLEGLLLDKALVAQVALVGSDVGVDQNVALHVGQQGELTATDATLMLLHSLQNMKRGVGYVKGPYRIMQLM